MTSRIFHVRTVIRWPVLVACVAFSMVAPSLAQWLTYPTAGVPRTRTGAVDLTAPIPRTFDGKPDLSGVWQSEIRNGTQFLDFGWSLKDGLPYQPWAAALVKTRMGENGKDDPYSRCLPTGVPRSHVPPDFLKKYVQVPGLLVILSEINASYRQIFLDGRRLPDDPQPSWNGYSSGKWEGDTLVVETAGLRDGLWLDRHGSPLTDAARVTERFQRLNYGTLQVDVTVDDPKAYTRPWTVRVNQTLVADTDLLDYICLENEKSVQHMVGK